LVGLPIAAAGVVLIVWRVKPGAASGWGLILTVVGLGILGFPQVTLIRGQLPLKQKRRSLPDRVTVTLSHDWLRYADRWVYRGTVVALCDGCKVGCRLLDAHHSADIISRLDVFLVFRLRWLPFELALTSRAFATKKPV